jgi:hypothetical protein
MSARQRIHRGGKQANATSRAQTFAACEDQAGASAALANMREALRHLHSHTSAIERLYRLLKAALVALLIYRSSQIHFDAAFLRA